MWLELVLNVACVEMSECVKFTAETGINENRGSLNETAYTLTSSYA